MKSENAVIPFHTSMIAPCGMNCGICLAHLRDKNQCAGCNSITKNKPHHCIQCSIKNCRALKESGGKYCSSCEKFPCRRLHQLDKRYRTQYSMSMIGNLRTIKQIGIRKFVHEEAKRWKCTNCGNIVSAHRPECLVCGFAWNIPAKQG